jgi:hypothetical protein
MKLMKSRLKYYMDKKSEELGFPVSASQIAHATHLRPSTIANWLKEDAFVQLNINIVSKLADYFGCDVWDMVEIVDVEESEKVASSGF